MSTKMEYYPTKNRDDLSEILMEQKWSGQQQLKLTSELSGKSEKEKEEIAARLVRQIESGEITKE
ncbi:MAG: hypothetical protein IJJ34_07055 [Clostridia bacterium]|nr:hypothetical protein [Clostridia bacterium]